MYDVVGSDSDLSVTGASLPEAPAAAEASAPAVLNGGTALPGAAPLDEQPASAHEATRTSPPHGYKR